MDSNNYFDTKTTNGLIRGEWAIVLIVSAVLLFMNRSEVNWWLAVVLFAYIDVIGTFPGLIAARRAKDGIPHRIFYMLYNLMHSAITQAVLVGLWFLAFGWNYSLLAIPLHLAADRAIFGNFIKPFGVPFDGTRSESFTRFVEDYSSKEPNVCVPLGCESNTLRTVR